MNEQEQKIRRRDRVILVLFGLFVAMGIWRWYPSGSNGERIKENPVATLGIYVTTSYGNPDNNTPGFISYSVWGRYGQKRVTVIDNGFDGILDKVVTDNGGSGDLFIDSNSPDQDWYMWTEIYYEIRTAVTTGK